MLLSLRRPLLRLRYPQRNLLSIRRRYKRTRLLRRRQARENMAKGHRVGADTEGWTPPTFHTRVSISYHIQPWGPDAWEEDKAYTYSFAIVFVTPVTPAFASA
jgi:hypothetical protein